MLLVKQDTTTFPTYSNPRLYQTVSKEPPKSASCSAAEKLAGSRKACRLLLYGKGGKQGVFLYFLRKPPATKLRVSLGSGHAIQAKLLGDF